MYACTLCNTVNNDYGDKPRIGLFISSKPIKNKTGIDLKVMPETYNIMQSVWTKKEEVQKDSQFAH